MPKHTYFIAILISLVSLSFSFTGNASSFEDFNPSELDLMLNHELYSSVDGLSQNTVTSIVEDREGYVWLGTINGLNRFDGNTFNTFYAEELNNGLPSSFIRVLHIDDSNTLYIGTDHGLVVYNPETEKFNEFPKSNIKNEKNSLKDSVIWAIHSDKDTLFVGIKNEIHIISKKEHKVVRDDRLKEIKKIRTIGKDIYIRNHDNDLVKITQNQLEIIENEVTTFDILEGELIYIKNNSLTDLGYKSYSTNIERLETNNGITLGFYNEKIYKFHLNNGEVSSNLIGSIKEYKQNTKYTSYHNNKNIYLSDFQIGYRKVSTSNNLSTDLNVDIHDIWVISNKFNNKIYIGTTSSIYKIDAKMSKESIIELKSESSHKSIVANQSGVYVGSSNGIEKFDHNLNKLKTINSNKITKIISPKENIIIASTFEGKILTFENDKIVETIDTKTNHPIYDLLYNNKNIYIASQRGVLKYSDGDITPLLSVDIATSFVKHNDKIYIGTRNAVLQLDINNDKISTFVETNKIIYSMAIYEDLLVASSTMEALIIDIETSKKYTITPNNGAHEDYSTQSIFKINDGIILAGPIGFSYLQPRKVLSNTPSSENLIFKDIFVFNEKLTTSNGELDKPLKFTNEIFLNYSDYPFSIEYGIIGKSNKNYNFYYRLKDFDTDWLPNFKNNTSTYTNIPYGEYVFEAYAVNLVSNKETDIASIKVNIAPPWWLSKLAKTIYGIITFIIIGLIVTSYLKRRKIQKQVALSEERLKLSLWGSGDEMWDWDIETGQIYRSNIWGSLDFPQDGHRSGKVGDESNIHPSDQARVQKALNDHFSGLTEHFEIAYRVKSRNDEWVWILDRAKIVERNQKDQPVRMTGTIKDINNIKQAEEQLRLFARAIENISEGMFILDESYHFVEVNEACCDLTGCSKTSFEGQLLEFTHYPKSYSEQIRNVMRQQGRWSGEIEAVKGDNSTFLMELTVDAIYNEQGDTSHYVGVFTDITHRKQQEEELRKLTNNDLLTGLPNRSSLQVTLSNLVKKDTHHTLMVLDVDNFKRINDSLGHQVGDELLVEMSQRIISVIPKRATLYRLGGDEFALLIDHSPDSGSSAVIASAINQALAPAFTVNKESIVLGISIGIVLYPEDEQNEQALLRKADIAMYHAKSAGGNRYQFYSEALNQNALRQLEVENLIREALKEDYFEVYYQPKINLKNNNLTGMEALVRLKHPTLGLISPLDFIPLAEENGLIIDIGDVVLRKACFAAKKWLQQGLFSGRVAVNLSSRQFSLTDLQQRIESILRLTQLPAKHLELEITEGTVIKDPEHAIKVMQQLSKMGVHLALDDFGTGYSSLSYLKRFPINSLKIDKSFVDDIEKSDRDLKMVDSIITIAHNMGLTVVGEGVEHNEQLSILKALKCEEIQGYIFSKPICEADFTQMLIGNEQKTNEIKETKS